MTTMAVILKPVSRGWAVTLTDGREVARFTGPGAKWRAMRCIARGGFSHAS